MAYGTSGQRGHPRQLVAGKAWPSHARADFADQRYVGVIRQAVKETFNFDIDIWPMGDVLHPSLDPGMWGLTTTGLSITCQGYDVDNGSGSASMEIPWAAFEGSVNPTLVKMLAKVAPITDRRLEMAGD